MPRRTLPRDPSAAALARRAVEADAGALIGEQLETARLLVSELVTNAVRHGDGDEILLDVDVDANRVRFEVRDGGGEVPAVREPSGGDGGYGLNLVASLASRWGADSDAGVWFELDRDAAEASAPAFAASGGYVGESAAGPLEGARSALAPSRWSAWVVAGVALVIALAGLDFALGRDALLGALLVLPALGCALVARWGDTLVVAALGALSTPLMIAWSRVETGETVVALLVVVLGGALAVLVALLRAAGEVNLRRFRLLSAVADVGNEATTLDDAVARLLDMLTPAFADTCALDAGIAGEERRVAVRPRGSEKVLAEALERGAGATRLVLPLRARGRTIGSLSALLESSGRRYSSADLSFAEVFAGRAAVVLDNAGLSSELVAAERQLDTVLEGLAEAVTVSDEVGRTVYANEAAVRLLKFSSAAELTGSSGAELMGRFEVYDETGAPVSLAQLPGSRARAGERNPGPMLVRNVVKATGEERWLLNKTTTIEDRDGRVVRVVNVIEDVTQTKRAELAQRLLAEASDALASSLDYEATLQRVAEVAVPAFADWCGVDLPGPGRVMQSVAVAHADPEKVALAHRLRDRYPVSADEPEGMPAVARGEAPSVVVSEIPDEALVSYARDEEHLAMLRGIGLASLLIVPLTAGGQTLGALTLARSSPGRVFDDADVQLAEELARRAGTAVLNARTYTERATIAATLQRGLRPPELLAPPGVAIATHYDAAGRLNEVGGDFYDAFPTDEGWMLVVGDVAGHGAEAAALTALARYTLRSAGQLTRDPARAAHQLNATLRDLPQLSLCTAVCAHVRTGMAPGEEATLTLANCGHPRPLRVRDGQVEELGGVGPMAGAFDDGVWECAEIPLHAGDVLVLYTDGVLDTVGEEDRFGSERLRATLADAGTTEPDVLVRCLAEALERFRRGPQRDDTAIAVVRFAGAASGASAQHDEPSARGAYESA